MPTQSSHPSSPSRPYLHWKRKVAMQLEMLEGESAEAMKQRRMQELRDKLEKSQEALWSTKRNRKK